MRVGFLDERRFFGAVFLNESTGETLELQRARSFSEQDRLHGMDTYCLVVSGGPSRYGGIVFWNVSGCRVHLSLTHEAAVELGISGELSIDIGDMETAPLAAMLERILS